MNRPDGFIFDVEGTLIDSAQLTLRCWQATLRDNGWEVSLELLQSCSGMDSRMMLGKLFDAPDPGFIRHILDEQNARYRRDYLPEVHAFEGAVQLFEDLRSCDLRIGVATSAEPDELQFYLRLIDGSGRIEMLIDAMVDGTAVAVEKPAPDLLLEALRRLSLPASRCWTIGDTPFDAEAAISVNAIPIGTTTGGFSRDQLRDAGCATTIAVATDLPGVLAGLEVTGGG